MESEREVKAREGKQELNKIRESGRVFPHYTCSVVKRNH